MRKFKRLIQKTVVAIAIGTAGITAIPSLVTITQAAEFDFNSEELKAKYYDTATTSTARYNLNTLIYIANNELPNNIKVSYDDNTIDKNNENEIGEAFIEDIDKVIQGIEKAEKGEDIEVKLSTYKIDDNKGTTRFYKANTIYRQNYVTRIVDFIFEGEGEHPNLEPDKYIFIYSSGADESFIVGKVDGEYRESTSAYSGLGHIEFPEVEIPKVEGWKVKSTKYTESLNAGVDNSFVQNIKDAILKGEVIYEKDSEQSTDKTIISEEEISEGKEDKIKRTTKFIFEDGKKRLEDIVDEVVVQKTTTVYKVTKYSDGTEDKEAIRSATVSSPLDMICFAAVKIPTIDGWKVKSTTNTDEINGVTSRDNIEATVIFTKATQTKENNNDEIKINQNDVENETENNTSNNETDIPNDNINTEEDSENTDVLYEDLETYEDYDDNNIDEYSDEYIEDYTNGSDTSEYSTETLSKTPNTSDYNVSVLYTLLAVGAGIGVLAGIRKIKKEK